MANHSDHITLVRQAARKWLEAQDALHSLKREWDALDLGNSITAADFAGENEGLTVAAISAVYTTLAAEDALMAQGHATNLFKAAK